MKPVCDNGISWSYSLIFSFFFSESSGLVRKRKSRAEIQRAYQERLKQKNNEEYLRKERERRRHKYIPAAQLAENDRIHRNTLNRERLRRCHQRKREARQRATLEARQTATREVDQTATVKEEIIVKLEEGF